MQPLKPTKFFRKLHQRVGRRIQVHPVPELQADPFVEGLDRRQLPDRNDLKYLALQPHLRRHIQHAQVR